MEELLSIAFLETCNWARIMATTGNSAEILSLEERIQTVTNLYNRFQSLRQIPTLLLRPPAPTDLPAAALSSIRPEFENVKEMRELVCSDAVQEALRAARESEKADGSALSSNFRRESRKRRCVCPHLIPSHHYYRSFVQLMLMIML